MTINLVDEAYMVYAKTQLSGCNFVNANSQISVILQNLVNCTHTKTYEHTYLWLTGYKERSSAFAT